MPEKKEIIDAFDIFHSFNLLNLLNECIEDCNISALPLLDKYEINKVDFVDLVKFNINYKQFYNNL